MEAKIEKMSELSKLLSAKTRMSDDFFFFFGKFGIGHMLPRLSMEKQDRVSASELLLSLCLFRIVGESIHSICKHKKSGVRMEGISRVFDHVKGRCVLSYKLLDGKF